ncbi:hypothetical protein BDZ94DRAFT_1265054, partial [Collybia nuda]
MSGSNNVRGPTSALTEFLREAGITATTVARRAATRNQEPVAGPSRTRADNEGDQEQAEDLVDANEATPRRPRTWTARGDDGYASDNLDEPEDEEKPTPATKKRKLTKAAEAKLKAKAKKNAKKGTKGDDDDNDSEEDAYTALSKSLWTNSSAKPPVGNFENCAKCEKQFTVTKYTMAANPGPGFLCHQCAKASGADPFKKPAAPKKRKAAADKRTIVNFEEKRFPALVTICIQLITKHINDVEALGDIGTLNMEAISKALSKNRGLTPENANLFYDVSNTTLTLFDATNLPSPSLTTLAYLNPNLTKLRLDFCGHLDDTAMGTFTTSLPSLTHIDLLGPFLVRVDAWKAFISAHPSLEVFLITQSPRFDLSCIQALNEHCGASLTALRLKEVGKLDDAFLGEIAKIAEKGAGRLRFLDLSDPMTSCSEEAMIELLRLAGPALRSLDVSGHDLLTDTFLTEGLGAYTLILEELTLSHLQELTDAGVAAFFDAWKGQPLTKLDMGRNHELQSDALMALLRHSGKSLEVLSINGWKAVGESALRLMCKLGLELRKVDVGWCREMDDFVVKDWMEGDGSASSGCRKLQEIKVWGCNKITTRCPKKKGISIYGIESHTVI